MTRRAILRLGILSIAVVAALAARAAVATDEDSYVAVTAPAVVFGREETLAVAAGGIAGCAPSEITYLKFDLSEVQRAAAGSAALALQATYALSANSGQVALYAAPEGAATWRESTLTWQNRPELAGAKKLAEVSAPTSSGPVVWQSAALAQAIDEASAYTDGAADQSAGDNVLSLALQLEGCRGPASVVRFAGREHASVAGPALTLAPAFTVWLPLLP
jgi:hypothetical protein